MADAQGPKPDSTAVRTALWRALHAEVDAPPHVIDDTIGLKLVAPGDDWRKRPDMDPGWTRRIRAAIAARARFLEDLVVLEAGRGVAQYVILGAGLDTFAQRRPEIASRLRVFEVDRPEPQAWKRERLVALGFGVPEWLRFVPVDFEAGASWWQRLVDEGFDATRPAVVASLGVSMYLGKEAISATLRLGATLAPGSTFAMTYLVPAELLDGEDRTLAEMSKKGAAGSGTPFVSFFSPDEMLSFALASGFKAARSINAATYVERYFQDRSDGLAPASGEDLLLATT